MRTRSILANLCFAAGGLFVCFSCGGVLPLSFPGAGFIPLLVFTGLLWLAAYIRTRTPSLRSIVRNTPSDWLLGIPPAICFWAGYIYHMLWLQLTVLAIVVLMSLCRDFARIREHNANNVA